MCVRHTEELHVSMQGGGEGAIHLIQTHILVVILLASRAFRLSVCSLHGFGKRFHIWGAGKSVTFVTTEPTSFLFILNCTREVTLKLQSLFKWYVVSYLKTTKTVRQMCQFKDVQGCVELTAFVSRVYCFAGQAELVHERSQLPWGQRTAEHAHGLQTDRTTVWQSDNIHIFTWVGGNYCEFFVLRL